MQPESLIEWPNAGRELLVFVSNMIAAGAVGFHFGVLRPSVTATAPELFEDARERAGWIGLIGALGQVALYLFATAGTASRKQLSFGGVVAAGGLSAVLQVIGLVLLVVGFLFAIRRLNWGWLLAMLGTLLLPLRGLATGDWTKIVTPLHRLAAGFWIGTLFVMLIAGIGIAFRRDVTGERRGRVVASMVRAFSPLALGSAGMLVFFGVITAWLRLKYLSALWTTPYGWTLIIKLCLVGVVVAFGAWNWRRVAPTLGSEQAATSIRRSSKRELTAAALVVLVTAILVSLPAPRKPDVPPTAGAPALVVPPAVP